MIDVDILKVGDVLKCLNSVYLGDIPLFKQDCLYDVVKIDKSTNLYTLQCVTRPVKMLPNMKIDGSVLETEFCLHTTVKDLPVVNEEHIEPVVQSFSIKFTKEGSNIC